MLTRMTYRDWPIVLEVFDAAKSDRGEPRYNGRKVLEPVLYFTERSTTWNVRTNEFGNRNSVGKRLSAFGALLVKSVHATWCFSE